MDLLPFGQIADPGDVIRWPGQVKSRMKVHGFQEAYDYAAELIFDEVKVPVIIPEMLVALKLSSWSLGAERAKDAIDVRLVVENVKTLCPDLENDFYLKENEGLFEKYHDNEIGLWISIFASRIQTLLHKSELSDYLKNLMNSNISIAKIIYDMNESRVPGAELEKKLKAIVLPLRDGLIR